ncbi:MAG: hypothetical protein RSE00_04365 [Clostridia bacterium]
MTSGELVFSLCDYSKEFIRNYKSKKLEQKVIDAIVVDYVNYFAASHCCMDLAMYTKDLRDGKKMSKEGTVLQKHNIMLPKDEYTNFGIIESVNRNRHMNDCGGKAEADNEEAVRLVETFITGYMDA